MASAFNVEFTMREAPAEAQARAANELTEPARLIGLRLTKRGAGELGYRPKVTFPFLIMLWHNLNGERMTARFEAGSDGGTHVTISGAVAKAKLPLASDPEHWTDALGSAAVRIRASDEPGAPRSSRRFRSPGLPR